MADALLTVENLTKSFGDKLLFEDISFGINAGQKSALIARNGYGKSTLLNIIMTAAEGERRASGRLTRNNWSGTSSTTSSALKPKTSGPSSSAWKRFSAA